MGQPLDSFFVADEFIVEDYNRRGHIHNVPKFISLPFYSALEAYCILLPKHVLPKVRL